MPTKAQLPKTQIRLEGSAKFPRAAEHLRWRIRRGEWRAGDRLPTFSDMCLEYGVTSNTISRALLTLEQEGLIVREPGRGVFVAQERRARQHAIGCLGFDLESVRSPYLLHLMAGVQRAAHGQDMGVMLLHPQSLRGLEKIDGVLLHGEQDEELQARLPPGMPCVNVMNPVSKLPAVCANDFDGMRAATQHLLDLGHRRIAVMVFVLSLLIQHRLAGYRAALELAGIEAQPSWIRDIPLKDASSLRGAVKTAMTRWLESDWHKLGCTAVLCQNDHVAGGVLQALREAKLRVPQDVSVVGFDGTEEGEHSVPRLTSVEVPLQEIGRRATELLLQQIHEEPPENGVLALPTRLVVRESTTRVQCA